MQFLIVNKKAKDTPRLKSWRHSALSPQPAENISAALLRLALAGKHERHHIRNRKGALLCGKLLVCFVGRLVDYPYVRKQVEYYDDILRLDIHPLNVFTHQPLDVFQCAALERYSYLLKCFRKLSFRHFALLLSFFEIGKFPRSELPLHSLENIFAHDRLVYIVAYYPLGFVLGAAAVADRLRHTFVADTTPMETGIGMSSNLAEYQKRIMVR